MVPDRSDEQSCVWWRSSCFSAQQTTESFNPFTELLMQVKPTYPVLNQSTWLGQDELAESFLKEPTREGEHILMDVNADGNVSRH